MEHITPVVHYLLMKFRDKIKDSSLVLRLSTGLALTGRKIVFPCMILTSQGITFERGSETLDQWNKVHVKYLTVSGHLTVNKVTIMHINICINNARVIAFL